MTDYQVNRTDLLLLLKQNFGFDSFRSLQEEIIIKTLEGADSVVLMPTGGGKSLCYQLPALVLPGITVVISPLIALMKDQVQTLNANGIPSAFLNSTLTTSQVSKVIDRLQQGQYRLLYIAPERLFAQGFMKFLLELPIGLFAIDEAHCISTWGHHFRPEYKKLSVLKERFETVPIMALTATADKAVRQDIAELLHLKDPGFYIRSFDRPNLSLSVLPGQKKWEQLLQTVHKYPGESGIIYCGSRATTEQLAGKLRKVGKNAMFYHAGMEASERSTTQDRFILGEVDIICATIAFGMGIDKADIRFVIHYNMPGNLESLYQEIGRAGRDGKPAETILFYSYRDVQTHLGFIDEVEFEDYKKILIAKLNRIQEYAEAQVCRRKILMTYFGESPGPDCGNCDVCANPPQYFDGTVTAQQALSAVVRSGEKLGISTLTEVLKGQFSQPVRENKWFEMKTFGVGRSNTYLAWQLYIQQMIQQGLMEIDYKDHYRLKMTEVGQKVLKGEPVRLVNIDTIKLRQAEQKKKAKVRIPAAIQSIEESAIDQGLLIKLKELRKNIANSIQKPAFMVFSDATIIDMAVRKPANQSEMLQVKGVGEYKARQYGSKFLAIINNH